MPLAFQYPAPGGTGAVDASPGNLVTACGTFDPGMGIPTIRGKVYPAAGPFDPIPPGDASGGFTNAFGAGTWHFNGCAPAMGGSSLSVGTGYVLRVWLNTGGSGFQVADCAFTACLSGSGCVPDCPAGAPGPGPGPIGFGCENIVIRDIAARQFRVTPSAGVAGMLEAFGLPKIDPKKYAILLTYDEVVSTHDRAIWVSQPQNGQQLRLEVIRGGCCHQALLTRIRVREFTVETLDRWDATCFDIVHGGELCGLTANCNLRDGGVVLRPVGDVLPVAPPLPPPVPARAAPAPRKRKGRK